MLRRLLKMNLKEEDERDVWIQFSNLTNPVSF